MNRQRAFTLIELLVVIGILVVLIAILLPSLSKARKAARTAVCLTNLRAIAQNMQLYFTETGTRRLGYRASNYNVNGASGFAENAWDCLFLGHGQTPNEYFLTDYRSAADKIRWCPETQFGPTSYAGMGTAHIRWNTQWVIGYKADHTGSYAFNQYLYRSNVAYVGGGPSERMEFYYHLGPTIKNPSLIPAFVDCEMCDLDEPDSTNDPPLDLEKPGLLGNKLGSACLNRHQMAVNVAFVDGHAQTVKLGDLWTLPWHDNWTRTTPAQVPAR